MGNIQLRPEELKARREAFIQNVENDSHILALYQMRVDLMQVSTPKVLIHESGDIEFNLSNIDEINRVQTEINNRMSVIHTACGLDDYYEVSEKK